MRRAALVLSCVHGGNRIPRRYSQLFQGADGVLASHRGFDRGALGITRALAKRYGVHAYVSTVSRLLVDLNRSINHPNAFSKWTRDIDQGHRDAIVARYYYPYRAHVSAAITSHVRTGTRVVHLIVHTFTPTLRGRVRQAAIGLLYDPARTREVEFCRAWQQSLRARAPRLRIRCNYPYRGTADGLPTDLREQFGREYLGIELEINQRHLRDPAGQQRIRSLVTETLAEPLALISS